MRTERETMLFRLTRRMLPASLSLKEPVGRRILTRSVCAEHVVPEDEQCVVCAAIIGSPNAGKSTLVNQLLGRKVFAVSPKVHTTNRQTLGVFTTGRTQVILLDTPGMVPYQYGRKLKLSKAFMAGPHRSLAEAEIAVVIVDASTKRTRVKLDPSIVKALRGKPDIPSVLVLNKVDIVWHKHVLLETVDELTGGQYGRKEAQDTESEDTESEDHHRRRELGDSKEEWRVQAVQTSWPHFQRVFMTSALTGDGVDDLRDYLVSLSRPGLWEYSVEEVTDQPILQLVEDVVREKLLLYLHKEIPYTITQENVIWEEREDGLLSIYQTLNCKSRSQASIVIGPSGSTIQRITAEAKSDIEALLKCSVDLTLNVRTRKK